MTFAFWHSVAVSGCLGLLLTSSPLAVARDDLGVTMRMVTDDDNLTESVVREIELREPVALERRQGNPADNAREARERGRDVARSAAERAREARHQSEQFETPELPERPDAPERPEQPELP